MYVWKNDDPRTVNISTSVTKYGTQPWQGWMFAPCSVAQAQNELAVLAVDQIDHGCVICSGYTEVPSFSSG